MVFGKKQHCCHLSSWIWMYISSMWKFVVNQIPLHPKLNVFKMLVLLIPDDCFFLLGWQDLHVARIHIQGKQDIKSKGTAFLKLWFFSFCLLFSFMVSIENTVSLKSFFVQFWINTEESSFCLCNFCFGDFRADLHFVNAQITWQGIGLGHFFYYWLNKMFLLFYFFIELFSCRIR